ncbi:hypothetical protein KJ612_01745 [Myxococcota bacterium]|nr:hypothetical protein [Myxococcota bacterium]
MVPLFLFSANCGSDFRPPGKLVDDEPQVLGIRAEPPEVGAGDTMTVDALVHWPQGEVHYLWFLCIPTNLEQVQTCVSSQITETLPPDCAGAMATLCTAGTDPTFDWTAPPIPLPEGVTEAFFFVQQVVSGSSDVWAACGQAIRDNIPTADCLISLKTVTYSSREVKNLNPRISHFVVNEAEVIPGEVAVGNAGEKLNFNVVIDAASLDELSDESEDTNFIYMNMDFYTTCGTIGTWGEQWYCEMSLDGTRTVTCLSDLEEETGLPNTVNPGKDFTGDCIVYALLRDNLGGITWYTQEFSFIP